VRIKELQIANWRSIKDLKIEVQDLMVFIGQNNHGKSNVLSSILFFFGETKAQDLDFNKGATELFVEATFSELDSNDKTTFKKYVAADGTIRVRKTAFIDGNFEYKGYIQNPVDDFLKEENASLYAKRELAAALPLNKYIPQEGRLSKQNIVDAQAKYISENLTSVAFKYELESTNFLGLKSVAKGIFGNVHFIPAVKDASDEFSSKEASTFGKIYARIIEAMASGNKDWNETRQKLSSLFVSLNKTGKDGSQNGGRPKELIEFEEALGKELAAWKVEIDIEVTPPDIDEVFKSNTQVWVNDGVRTDIKRKGHGLQRALTFGLIKVLSDVLKKEKAAADLAAGLDAAKEGKSEGRIASNSTFFILEEPELYLHPQAQRLLYESLIGLTITGHQVLLCTHSSSLVNVEEYKSICIIKKDSDNEGTKVSQCTKSIFSGDAKKDFNLAYWINPDRGELFFAKKVILTEGQTDKTIIPNLAKRLSVFRHEYTIIDCGSKTSIPLYCSLLNNFKIPYLAVYDKDHQSGKDPNAINIADRDSKLIEDSIDKSIGESLVFINDIEEEIGLAASNKNKPYHALTHVNSATYSINATLEAKIRRIYQ
jgi:hypothetical protein